MRSHKCRQINLNEAMGYNIVHGASLSFVAPSNEELQVQKDKFAMAYNIVHGVWPET